MKKEFPKGRPSKHRTVRVPKAMAEAIEEFLETDVAKKMGYLYKVDVVTAGIRQLLLTYGFYNLLEKEPKSPPEATE